MINRYFIRGGNDMDDYIFCLSVDETAYVDYYGNVDDYGAHVSNRIIGVCPALWLKLNP